MQVSDKYMDAANSMGISAEELLTADASTLSQLAYEAVINKNPHAEFLTFLASKAYNEEN